MSMRYEAVVFDFDYTLGDATDAIYAGFVHGFQLMGYPVPDRETVRHTIGLLLADAYRKRTGGESQEGRARCRALFSSVARPMQAAGIPLCEGAEALLRALGAAGIATAVVSTKHTETLESIFDHYGLRDTFAFIIGGDLVSKPKPDPEGLDEAARRLGLDKGEILYCGDTTIDANAARNAGMDFCAVLNGTTPGEAFAGLPHVHIAPDLIELRTWLGLDRSAPGCPL